MDQPEFCRHGARSLFLTKRLRILVVWLGFTSTLLLNNGCGPGGSSPLDACTPDFESSGFSVALVPQGSTANTYVLTVCSNSSHKGAVFSLYGARSESEISGMDPVTHVRLGHLSDASTPGSRVEITFREDDTWLVAFEDEPTSGGFTLATTKEMVRGRFR